MMPCFLMAAKDVQSVKLTPLLLLNRLHASLKASSSILMIVVKGEAWRASPTSTASLWALRIHSVNYPTLSDGASSV